MPGNSDPIFSKVGFTSGAFISTAASIVYDISGTVNTDIYLLFSADATNGSWVDRLVTKYASNATTASVQAVLKIWLSSVGTGNTITTAQARLIDEIPLPNTGALTTTAASPKYEIPLKFAMDPGYFLLGKITVSQTNANCGWATTVFGGKY